MYLFEYQAKALMREKGIPVLEGIVATSEQRALDAARELGEGPWVIKAQIHAGGRGKGTFTDGFQGGVKIANDKAEAEELATGYSLGAALL